jgi:hypothetical protein
MPNQQSMCTSFKQDMLNGIHAFGASVVRGSAAKDSFKMALYLTSANLGAGTPSYSAVGELAATGGYVAGGVVVPNATVPSSSGTTAFWTPSGSVVWNNLTSSAAFDAALLYNDSSLGKNSVSVHAFGAQMVTAGTFTLTMPANDASNALIRIG